MKATDENKAAAVQQLERLGGKSFAPTDPVAATEVVRALLDCCVDLAHVSRTIDEILRKPGNFPEPAVFREVARQVADMERKPDYACVKCGGTGRIAHRFGGVTVMVRCMCGGDQACEICTGKGSFAMLRGGITGVEDCNCIDYRPKSYRAPWQPEGCEEVPR